jgi:hypothetical protein
MPTPPGTVFQLVYRELFLEFLAQLLHATHTADTPAAFQGIVQTFCDELVIAPKRRVIKGVERRCG